MRIFSVSPSQAPALRRRSAKPPPPRLPAPGRFHHRLTLDLALDPFEEVRVLGPLRLVRPHHERVLVGLGVVVLPYADGREAEPAVELLGGAVREPHLEREAARFARD